MTIVNIHSLAEIGARDMHAIYISRGGGALCAIRTQFFLSSNITASWFWLPWQMCKIWISWISTTDFSRVIVGYLRLHNILAIFRREKPLGAAGGVAVRVVDRLLVRT